MRRICCRIRALLPNGTPTPEALQQLSDEALRGVGLSRQKLGYMRDLSRKMLDGTIDTAGLAGRNTVCTSGAMVAFMAAICIS